MKSLSWIFIHVCMILHGSLDFTNQRLFLVLGYVDLCVLVIGEIPQSNQKGALYFSKFGRLA